MRMCGLEIDFPDIEGVSYRQESYAEYLRENYVENHINRFREIEEIALNIIDNRSIDYMDDGENDRWIHGLNDQERVCLFAQKAGGIIASLKE